MQKSINAGMLATRPGGGPQNMVAHNGRWSSQVQLAMRELNTAWLQVEPSAGGTPRHNFIRPIVPWLGEPVIVTAV